MIIVTHRPAALSGLDQLLVMSGGQVQAFGPKDEVLRKVVPMPAATGQSTSGRLKVVQRADRKPAEYGCSIIFAVCKNSSRDR